MLNYGDTRTLEEILPIVDEDFDRIKGKLFLNPEATFIGSLICRLKMEWDAKIDTACTNGTFLKWNPYFYLKLDEATRITVLAHEAWHVAYQHMFRLDGREMEHWQIACDHVVNLTLKYGGFDMDGFPYYMDDRFKDMSTEQVYEIVKEEAKKDPKKGPKCGPGSFGEQFGDSFGIDMIMSDDPDEQIESMQNVIAAQTMAQATRTPGTLPGELTEMIEKFTKPKLNWRTILANFFEAQIEDDYSYRRPNRRHSQGDFVLPSLVGQEGLEHLVYYIDVSGSITQAEIKLVTSELAHIQNDLNPERLTIVQFDTQIQEIIEYEKDEEFDSITIVGRGGTDLRHVYEHAAEVKPTCMVIFTDLYVTVPTEPPACPLIWIATNSPVVPPYGTHIQVTTDD